MKIKILQSVGYRGTVLDAGTIVDVTPDDLLWLLQSGRAEALDRADHAKALEQATQAAVRLERQASRGWRQ